MSPYLELEVGSKYNNLVLKKGNACIKMTDTNGKVHRNILKNVLYILSFDKNIFSWQEVTENGANIEFKPNFAILNANGMKFKIHKKDKFYHLNNVTSLKKVKQIEVIENSERIKTHPKHLSDYNVNDEVNGMSNYSIDYCYHRTLA